MNDRKKYNTFPVQAKGGAIYQVTIGSIKAEPEDRYGWKKDHLSIWLEFNPCVGSTLGTFTELPIKEYTGEEFLIAIMKGAQETVNRLEVEYEERKKAQEAADKHKAELDAYAERVISLLEPRKVPN